MKFVIKPGCCAEWTIGGSKIEIDCPFLQYDHTSYSGCSSCGYGQETVFTCGHPHRASGHKKDEQGRGDCGDKCGFLYETCPIPGKSLEVEDE